MQGLQVQLLCPQAGEPGETGSDGQQQREGGGDRQVDMEAGSDQLSQARVGQRQGRAPASRTAGRAARQAGCCARSWTVTMAITATSAVTGPIANIST